MRTALFSIVTCALGFAAGWFCAPRGAGNEAGLLRIIGTQQALLDTKDELIATLEREREEIRAAGQDRAL